MRSKTPRAVPEPANSIASRPLPPGCCHQSASSPSPVRPTRTTRRRQVPLGPHRTRLTERSDQQARIAASQRCFQPAHASHVVKDEHPGFLWLSARTGLTDEALIGSRLGPRFG